MVNKLFHRFSIALIVLSGLMISNGCQASAPTNIKVAEVNRTETDMADGSAVRMLGHDDLDKPDMLQEKKKLDDSERNKTDKKSTAPKKKMVEKKMEIATFGNGCYWCTEAIFQRVKGVESVSSGFMGGHVDNPSYEAVCLGTTGHAEVLHVQYDANVVSYEKLLEVFWRTHDPTTLNRQGNDVGTQYRSAVFYHNDNQKELAIKYKKKLGDAKAFENPIVTEITKASKFYKAPEYHQDYYNQNKHKNPYCGLIQVKLDKFRKAFADVIDKDKDKVK